MIGAEQRLACGLRRLPRHEQPSRGWFGYFGCFASKQASKQALPNPTNLSHQAPHSTSRNVDKTASRFALGFYSTMAVGRANATDVASQIVHRNDNHSRYHWSIHSCEIKNWESCRLKNMSWSEEEEQVEVQVRVVRWGWSECQKLGTMLQAYCTRTLWCSLEIRFPEQTWIILPDVVDFLS